MNKIFEDVKDYDAGYLNDYGGGNVGWWQDYIRYEIGKCNDYWRSQLPDKPEPITWDWLLVQWNEIQAQNYLIRSSEILKQMVVPINAHFGAKEKTDGENT